MSDKYKGKSTRKSEVSTDGLSKDLMKVHQELQEKFPDSYILTSAKRKRGEIHSENSHHYHGNAIDIVPNPEIYDYLMNSKEGLELLASVGAGIYDETDPKNMRKATGAHYHIGKDKVPASIVKERYSKITNPETVGEFQRMEAFNMKEPDFNYTRFLEERNKKVGNKGEKEFNDFQQSYVQDYQNYRGVGASLLGATRTGLSGFAVARQTQEGIQDYQLKGDEIDTDIVYGQVSSGTYTGPEKEATQKNLDEEELTKKIIAELKREQEIEELKKSKETEAQRALREEEERKLSQIEEVIAMNQKAIVEQNPQEQVDSPYMQPMLNPLPEYETIDIFEWPWDNPQAKYGGKYPNLNIR